MAHQDYVPLTNTRFGFEAGDERACFDIEIVDDRRLEQEFETFNVTLMPSAGLSNIVFNPYILEVGIFDDDST